MKRTLCLFLQLTVLPQIAVRAQDKTEHKFKSCRQAEKLIDKSWDDDTALLASARDYLTHCSAETGATGKARLLLRMGSALIHMRQFSESVPILEECVDVAAKNELRGDFTSCLVDLGTAAANQGQCDLAQIHFKAVLGVGTTDNLTSVNHDLAKWWVDDLEKADSTGILQLPSPREPFKCCSEIRCLPPLAPSVQKSNPSQSHLYGTAFFVSSDGQLLTNDHVVSNCASVNLGTGEKAQIVIRDAKSDLALLKIGSKAEHFATFRAGVPVALGETVMAFGFPFPGTLSSGGVATSGIVSSLAGLHDDPRTLQFSAAVQPGNSGGPLLDGNGHVIGVVEAKLDALEMVKESGSIPENVGFAIKSGLVRAFLESADVSPASETIPKVSSSSPGYSDVPEGYTVVLPAQPNSPLPSSDVARIAKQITVAVDCTQ
jgi:S1-C subfamily serine protease